MTNASKIELSRGSIDVMFLLLNAVFADHVTERKEIEIIMNAFDDLNLSKKDDTPLSHSELLQWLEQNHDTVKAQYSGSKRHIELVILLTRMARRNDLEGLAKIVIEICRSDGVYDHNEKILLDMMNSYWK